MKIPCTNASSGKKAGKGISHRALQQLRHVEVCLRKVCSLWTSLWKSKKLV